MRRATFYIRPYKLHLSTFLSTLSLRRATDPQKYDRANLDISIHALLAESDPATSRNNKHNMNFYPRSPCGERRVEFKLDFINQEFLSTLSLRRATSNIVITSQNSMYFYPRSPCGERLHAPSHNLYLRNISIHALLAESDELNSSWISSIKNFYPRSPCGERLIQNGPRPSAGIFLSTLSLRRAT